jgi:NAD(P)-dependent dehydrogenase (short-subunit alcohol dehydrogenase family)
VLDLNLLSIARSNQVFLPLLLEQKRGHVVNTASVHGLLAHGFDRLPYVASKHAIVAVSEALAIYLGPRGIGVTCVCPSRVLTNIAEQVTTYGEPPPPRALQHPIVEVDAVGELIVDAISAGTFLVVSAPEVHDELRERAADPEAYIRRLIREQQS